MSAKPRIAVVGIPGDFTLLRRHVELVPGTRISSWSRIDVDGIIEDGYIGDGEGFLERAFTHHRLRTELLRDPSRARLIAFHSEHKLLYLAHSPARYRELGRLVAGARPLSETVETYATAAMAALAEPATRGKHANVLQHVVGYFKKLLTAAERGELLSRIEDFRLGLCALPRALFVHLLRKHDVPGWLKRQWYFQPYPDELRT